MFYPYSAGHEALTIIQGYTCKTYSLVGDFLIPGLYLNLIKINHKPLLKAI